MAKRLGGRKSSHERALDHHLNRNRKMYKGLPEEKNRMTTKEVWSFEKAERAGRKDAKITREHNRNG